MRRIPAILALFAGLPPVIANAGSLLVGYGAMLARRLARVELYAKGSRLAIRWTVSSSRERVGISGSSN